MLFHALRPAIHALDPERAHRLTIAALKTSPLRKAPHYPESLAIELAGIRFPTPLGLAPGFDKDAEVPRAMLALGFGHVEVGTLTPLPQPGNPKPRLFRLAEDQAVINRMGFNNGGLEAAHRRLLKLGAGRSRRTGPGIVGVNVGANKETDDRVADYRLGVSAMAGVADYITVNISSPNTPGLRNLQAKGELETLLEAIASERLDGDPPVFLKVAPDLEEGDHERIVRAALDNGIAALIISNTTITRPPLSSPQSGEAGGLSGAPLRTLALDQLRRFYAVAGGDLPLIGVGGIASAADAWERIRAGASLVQLYSALVYEGPGLARRITDGLQALMQRDGFERIADAIGSE